MAHAIVMAVVALASVSAQALEISQAREVAPPPGDLGDLVSEAPAAPVARVKPARPVVEVAAPQAAKTAPPKSTAAIRVPTADVDAKRAVPDKRVKPVERKLAVQQPVVQPPLHAGIKAKRRVAVSAVPLKPSPVSRETTVSIKSKKRVSRASS